MRVDQIGGLMLEQIMNILDRLPESGKAAFKRNFLIMVKRKSAHPRAVVASDLDLMPARVHGGHQIKHIARKPARVGGEGQVEDSKRMLRQESTKVQASNIKQIPNTNEENPKCAVPNCAGWL